MVGTNGKNHKAVYKLLQEAAKKTNFTSNEIQHAYSVFNKATDDSELMSRSQFKAKLGLQVKKPCLALCTEPSF